MWSYSALLTMTNAEKSCLANWSISKGGRMAWTKRSGTKIINFCFVSSKLCLQHALVTNKQITMSSRLSSRIEVTRRLKNKIAKEKKSRCGPTGTSMISKQLARQCKSREMVIRINNLICPSTRALWSRSLTISRITEPLRTSIISEILKNSFRSSITQLSLISSIGSNL